MSKYLFIPLFAIVLSACSTTPSKTSFDKTAANIQTISLVNPPVVQKVSVRLVSNPVRYLGIAGRLSASVNETLKTNRYNNTVKSYAPNWTELMDKAIQKNLRQQAYQVTPLKITRTEENATGFSDNYPKTNTDAVLEYYFEIAQIAAKSGQPYIPSVVLTARLRSSKDGKTLFQQQYRTGNLAYLPEATTVETQTANYNNTNTLNAKGKESVQHLKTAIDVIAQRLAQDLAR